VSRYRHSAPYDLRSVLVSDADSEAVHAAIFAASKKRLHRGATTSSDSRSSFSVRSRRGTADPAGAAV
jgi:hypothetical protein